MPAHRKRVALDQRALAGIPITLFGTLCGAKRVGKGTIEEIRTQPMIAIRHPTDVSRLEASAMAHQKVDVIVVAHRSQCVAGVNALHPFGGRSRIDRLGAADE